MALFADWVARDLTERGWSVEMLKPQAILARRAQTTLSGLGKWLGYIDKFILFPQQLKQLAKAESKTVFLVADHSNAYYARFLPRTRTVVTCHDVLAIEGALGDPEAFCLASKTGKLFQKWILKSLKNAPAIAFVSRHTETSYLKLPGSTAPDQQRSVIPNGINQTLRKLDEATVTQRLEKLNPDLLKHPYLLHVGSSLPRKNRAAVMEAFVTWASDNGDEDPLLVFVGKPLSDKEAKIAQSLKVSNRLRVLENVSTENLEAIYNAAFAFCFPSFSEGFGWPIIEAQSCGTPVIAGNRSCLPEIAGEKAILCDPYKPETITQQLHRLKDQSRRDAAIEQGFHNLKRFTPEVTLGAYARLFESLLKAHTPSKDV